MTIAVYRYCSNPYSFPKLYSNTRCEVLGSSGRRVKIRLLEFSRGHKPNDILRVLRKNITITGGEVPLPATFNKVDIRLPYKD
jgi:hypothetical protein